MAVEELGSARKPHVPADSAVTGNSATQPGAWTGSVLVDGQRLCDAHGRTLLVRGVNMSGNSKLPTSPAGSSRHTCERFFEHRTVSFVGRPFPLAEADEHFERLHAWGLSFARLLVPWEALEHAGPGIYDEEYIDFLIALLRRAPEYGIKCFIVHYHDFAKHNDEGGKMIWPTNYIKLASATMFTLFFAGDELAPKASYNGESPQSFLQRHFCGAYAHLARRLKDAKIEAVVGFEVMNEPHPGYIGLRSLQSFDLMKDLHLSCTPTPIQSFALGSGIPQTVAFFVKSWPWPTRKAGTRLLNEDGKSAWLPGRHCIWREHGVWDVDSTGKPVAVKPDYFTNRRDGSPLDFNRDFYAPFVKRYSEAIRRANPDAIVFFEPIPNDDPPMLIHGSACSLENTVYAPHWYDLNLSRGTKNVLQASYFGLTGARRNYKSQIACIVRTGAARVGPMPCLVGECGIPMDINEKEAFDTGDYTHHTNFLDAVISAMESNLVNFTLWNYNPHNDNVFGDHWNGEDFSIFSKDNSAAPSRTHSRSQSRQVSFVDLPLPAPESLGQTDRPPATAPATTHHQLSSAPTRSTLDAQPASSVGGFWPFRTRKSSKLQIEIKRQGPQAEPGVDEELEERDDVAMLRSESNRSNRSAGSASGHWRERRTSLTPITPFDITELCYNDPGVDAFGHTHAGGRALDAVIRPYAAKIAGTPLRMRFDLRTLEFEFFFSTPVLTSEADLARAAAAARSSPVASTTEIFVPSFHYGALAQPGVTVSDGSWTYDRMRQTLVWAIDPTRRIEPWVDEPPFSLWQSLFPDEETLFWRSVSRDVNVHWIRITVPPNAT
ncbi:hypothetical protein HK105_205304 [Polyrhizophydium stewartii]|uniref:Glycoside hydrolase family 5 C-terminal domain-containing protein n=1 Tax=Polyrhizophydium stewartii TaxID=2732419 RepID=A0ABR4N6Q3_9FUNG